MTDWNALKVVELKEELKSRGVPLTGLKLKQHYVDKLNELDAQQSNGPSVDKAQEISKEGQKNQIDDSEQEIGHSVVSDAKVSTPQKSTSEVVPADDENALKSTAQQDEHSTPAVKPPSPAGSEPDGDLSKDGVAEHLDTNSLSVDSPKSHQSTLVAEELQDSVEKTHGVMKPPAASPLPPIDPQSENKDTSSIVASVPQTHVAEPNISGTSTPTSIHVSPTDLVEDSRKRKRRSVTPPPTVADIAQKRARANDGTPIAVTRGSREPEEITESLQAATEEMGATSATKVSVDEPGSVDDKDHAVGKGGARDPFSHTAVGLQHVPTPRTQRSAIPAKHPSTAALYLRNFKRPLHIPSLRAHITAIAKSHTSSSGEPVKLFYLNNIRTHAFISFGSVQAAVAVRESMHGMPFPDEPGRDPLLVDFVPEEALQKWIDTEAEGGRGASSRFEVVYEERGDVIEAIHQEVGRLRGKSLANLSSSTQPTSSDRAPARPDASSVVHPDRASLIPQDSLKASQKESSQPRATNGTGFKALDELFSFTTAKPKLYYKPVAKSVADQRLDMLHRLKVGYAGMGRSGDEGMKRYSFEPYRGREEWVNKGPEFGYGKRGVDRLAGRSRGSSSYKGSRFDRGDSWRG